MKLRILSDLHLEVQKFQPCASEVDAVILAGDIDLNIYGLRWASRTFGDTPVIYVAGNHEFYNNTFPKAYQDLKRAAKGTTTRFLEMERVDLDNVVFLGCTLWTDFSLDGNATLAKSAAKSQMADFKLIRMHQDYRIFTPDDSLAWHNRSRAWLEEQLEVLRFEGKKVVVVTHHAPSSHSIAPQFIGNDLNPAFASPLDDLIANSKINLWIHGHTHAMLDYHIGETRIVCNPRGYSHDAFVGFKENFVVEI